MNSTIITAALASLFLFAACAMTPENADPGSISPGAIVGEWNVERIEDSPVGDQGKISMGFGEDGRVFGNGGVNRLLGTWSLDNGKLELSKLGSTRMAGPPELMKQESEFLAALGRVARATLDQEGRLILRSADGSAMITASSR